MLNKGDLSLHNRIKHKGDLSLHNRIEIDSKQFETTGVYWNKIKLLRIIRAQTRNDSSRFQLNLAACALLDPIGLDD